MVGIVLKGRLRDLANIAIYHRWIIPSLPNYQRLNNDYRCKTHSQLSHSGRGRDALNRF